MSNRIVGFLVLGLGVFAILFSLSVDYIGIGKKGIQAAQLLGIQAGFILTILGWLLAKHLIQPFSFYIIKLKERLALTSPLILAVIGFVFVYIWLFAMPLFLNPSHRIHYFIGYLPDKFPIGTDLLLATGSISGWLSGQSLYTGQSLYYPPLYAAIFAPILLLTYPSNFYLVTFLTLISLAILFFAVPELTKGSRKEQPLLVFFFLTALFSCGLQLEIERGQFNIIAITFCFLAIYIYHYHDSLRYYAYLLFSISIQLKLYPAVYIFMFIKDWRDWKGNLRRILGLGAFNILVLFILGWKVFLDYTKALWILMSMVWVSPHNHSIRSFAYGLAGFAHDILPSRILLWVGNHPGLIEKFLVAYYLLCLLIVIVRAYNSKERGMNSNLLLICTIGCMLLPSTSLDYKLPLVAFPLAIVLSNQPLQLHGFKKILVMLLVVIVSFSYSITLFSFIYKPSILANNTLMLLVILTAITILSFFEYSTNLSGEN